MHPKEFNYDSSSDSIGIWPQPSLIKEEGVGISKEREQLLENLFYFIKDLRQRKGDIINSIYVWPRLHLEKGLKFFL